MTQNPSLDQPPAISLPETGYIRIKELVKLVPISKSTIWLNVKSGRFPKPVKLSTRITAWHVNDIRAYINSFVGKQ